MGRNQDLEAEVPWDRSRVLEAADLFDCNLAPVSLEAVDLGGRSLVQEAPEAVDPVLGRIRAQDPRSAALGAAVLVGDLVHS